MAALFGYGKAGCIEIAPEQLQMQTVGVNISNVGNTGNIGNIGNIGNTDTLSVFSESRIEYSIEQHLYSFSGFKEYAPLWATWVLDKEAYRKRLSTISQSFPAFSTHDADHSEVILTRIESLLGEGRIRLLSPTDAWLLLETAYSHDIGMSVSEDEKDSLFSEMYKGPAKLRELAKNPDFIEFLREIDCAGSDASLKVYNVSIASARFLLRMLDSTEHDKTEWEHFIEQIQRPEYSRAKKILSDVMMRYMRKKHGERSRDTLIKEAQQSTQNDVLPVRLRLVIAKIDYCHATDWKDILSTLPRKENGIHTDFIHPRFIAALLRLGDLLDMDSNRFNPYQIDLIGRMQKDNIIHKLKNMAVCRFRVDTKWIDIEARYRKYDVKIFLDAHYFSEKDSSDERENKMQRIIDNSANSMRSWLDMLQEDLRDFSLNWNNIAPRNMPAGIAALRQNDIYIYDSDTPVEKDELELRYSISPQRASQLIEGAELYENPLVFIREIVQNSIDTTKRQLIKSLVVLDDTGEASALGYSEEDFQESNKKLIWQSVLNKYKVRVNFEYNHQDGSHSGAAGKDLLKVTVQDYGIGITYQKLQQMRQIGSIMVSREEKDEEEIMPDWLKPTGAFGIGMQSIFTVTDRFHITTYPRYEEKKTNIKRDIWFYCPELGGDIVKIDSEKTVPAESARFGSDLIIDIDLTGEENNENIKKLMHYNNPFIAEKRSAKIQHPGVLESKLRKYLLGTFTEDIVGLEFKFDGFGDSDSKSIVRNFPFADSKNADHCLGKDCNIIINEEDGKAKILYWYNGYSADGAKHTAAEPDNTDSPKKDSVLLTFSNSDGIGSTELFFKGIKVENRKKAEAVESEFHIPYIDLKVNIMSGAAGKVLEINRDNIKPECFNEIKNILRNSLLHFYADLLRLIPEKLPTPTEPQNDVTLLMDFFCDNPMHQSIFYSIVSIYSPKLWLDTTREEADKQLIRRMNTLDEYNRKRAVVSKDVLKKQVSMMLIKDGKTFHSTLLFNELREVLRSNNLWYTKYDFYSSFSEYEILNNASEDLDGCGIIYDNLSDFYGLFCGEVRVIRNANWDTQYYLVYTLSDDKNRFPNIPTDDYRLLRYLITVNYLQKYREETDVFKKQAYGNYYLTFPATEDFNIISVDRILAETPDELAGNFSRYVPMPISVRDLWECTCESFKNCEKSMLGNYQPIFNGNLLNSALDKSLGSIAKINYIQSASNQNVRLQKYKAFFEDLTEKTRDTAQQSERDTLSDQ